MANTQANQPQNQQRNQAPAGQNRQEKDPDFSVKAGQNRGGSNPANPQNEGREDSERDTRGNRDESAERNKRSANS